MKKRRMQWEWKETSKAESERRLEQSVTLDSGGGFEMSRRKVMDESRGIREETCWKSE